MNKEQLIKDFLLSTIKGLVENHSELDIKIKNKNNYIEFFVIIDKKESGKIIGKYGRTIKAIKTLFNSISTNLKIEANLKFNIPSIKK